MFRIALITLFLATFCPVFAIVEAKMPIQAPICDTLIKKNGQVMLVKITDIRGSLIVFSPCDDLDKTIKMDKNLIVDIKKGRVSHEQIYRTSDKSFMKNVKGFWTMTIVAANTLFVSLMVLKVADPFEQVGLTLLAAAVFLGSAISLAITFFTGIFRLNRAVRQRNKAAIRTLAGTILLALLGLSISIFVLLLFYQII